jgi:amidohydrolase
VQAQGVAWRAIFQPAEETGEGAREMITAGAVEGVRAIVALHVDPELRVGRVARRVGAVTASVDDVEITVRGRGGHAARPHHATDPIAVACQFVTSVYTLVPRSVDARDPVVVTFGSIRGGANHNVIPDRVTLLGTVRALSRASAERVRQRLMDVARGLTEASGAEVEVGFRRSIAEVVNDPHVTEVCSRAAAEVVGAEGVEAIPLASMGGEDFGGYLAHAPGCLLRLGVAPPEGPGPRLHAPDFDLDERALVLGAKILARSAVLLASEADDHGTHPLRPQ